MEKPSTATSVPLAPPRRRVLFVASVAGGGGDVAFAGGVLRALLAADAPPLEQLALAVCKQAGGSAAAALLELARDVPAPLLARLASVRLLERAGAGARDARGADAESEARLPPALQELLRAPRFAGGGGGGGTGDDAAAAVIVVLQGPLRVFSSGAEALAAGEDALSAPPPPPPPPLSLQARLVTVREFGQARFAALAGSASPHAGDKDVSAGLADDELGVFDVMRAEAAEGGGGVALDELLARLPAGAAREAVGGAPRRAFAVGYFRAAGHAVAFGRAVAVALVIDANAGKVEGELPPPFVVFAPVSDSAAYSSLLAGLRSHPLVAGVEQGGNATRLSVLLRGGARRHLELSESMGLGLPRPCFRLLLSRARLAAVTGDATLNEALAFGVPFVYSCEGHKGGVRDSLRALVAADGTEPAAAVVAAFWAFCEGGGVVPWAAFERSMSGSGWLLFAGAFAEWSARVMAERGGLGERICAIVHEEEARIH